MSAQQILLAVLANLACAGCLMLAGFALMPSPSLWKGQLCLQLCRSLLLGIAADLCATLALDEVRQGGRVCLLLAFLGITRLFPKRARQELLGRMTGEKGTLLLVALLFAGLTVRLCTLQALACDYSATWEFHGRVLAQTGGFSAFSDPAFWFSHPGYPPAMGVLTAQLLPLAVPSFAAGRLSLALLALPGIFVFVSLVPNKPVPAAAWFCVFFLTTGSLTWSGFLDGHLALTALCSALLLALWSESGDAAYLDLSLALAVYSLLLKNEGVLFVSCWGAGFLVLFAWARGRISLPRFPDCLPALLLLSSAALWEMVKRRYAIPQDLGLDPEMVGRMLSRAVAASFSHFLSPLALVEQASFRAALFCAPFMLVLEAGMGGVKRTAAALVSMAGCYLALLVLVYLGTPYSLEWHLATSLQRTLMVPQQLLLAAALFTVAAPKRVGANPSHDSIDKN